MGCVDRQETAIARNDARLERFWVPLLALALAFGTFALRYPGALSPDATAQYQQAITGSYNDWHPPVMAYLWSKLLILSHGPAAMLAVHVFLYWGGLCAIADGLRRVGRPISALVVLLSGISPLILYYVGIIYKDVGLSSAFLAGFGLIFWHKAQGHNWRWWSVVGVVAVLAYGTLVRSNGPFALAPIALYALHPKLAGRAGAWSIAALATVIVAMFGSQLVNRQVFKASKSGVEQTLQLYDLVGIAHHSGDNSVLPNDLRSGAAVRGCYTPRYWDALHTAACGNIFDKLATPGTAARNAMTGQWLRAIVRHPIAYSVHRLKHYNASLNFFVPALSCRFAPFDEQCGDQDPRGGRSLDTPATQKAVEWDYVKKNALVWPATWLAMVLAMLVLLGRSSSPTATAARALLLSGAAYGGAYLVVGVATDIRYYLWTFTALQTAAILGWPEFWNQRKSKSFWAAASIVLIVVLLGYCARLLDLRLLMV